VLQLLYQAATHGGITIMRQMAPPIPTFPRPAGPLCHSTGSRDASAHKPVASLSVPELCDKSTFSYSLIHHAHS